MLALRSSPSSAVKLSTRAFSSSRPSSLARLSIIGRLGQVPTIAKDKQGRDVIIYSVGTSDKITSSASDGPNENTTTWHRVLHYNTTENAKAYLSALPTGTLVHVEADHKKRTLKDDAGKYSEQTLNLLKNIEVLQKPKKTEDSPTTAEQEAQGN